MRNESVGFIFSTKFNHYWSLRSLRRSRAISSSYKEVTGEMWLHKNPFRGLCYIRTLKAHYWHKGQSLKNVLFGRTQKKFLRTQRSTQKKNNTTKLRQGNYWERWTTARTGVLWLDVVSSLPMEKVIPSRHFSDLLLSLCWWFIFWHVLSPSFWTCWS